MIMGIPGLCGSVKLGHANNFYLYIKLSRCNCNSGTFGSLEKGRTFLEERKSRHRLPAFHYCGLGSVGPKSAPVIFPNKQAMTQDNITLAPPPLPLLAISLSVSTT
jgi:hypothetical protein